MHWKNRKNIPDSFWFTRNKKLSSYIISTLSYTTEKKDAPFQFSFLFLLPTSGNRTTLLSHFIIYRNFFFSPLLSKFCCRCSWGKNSSVSIPISFLSLDKLSQFSTFFVSEWATEWMNECSKLEEIKMEEINEWKKYTFPPIKHHNAYFYLKKIFNK